MHFPDGICRAQQEEVNNNTFIPIYLCGREAEEWSWVSGLPGQDAVSLLLCSTELRHVVSQPGLFWAAVLQWRAWGSLGWTLNASARGSADFVMVHTELELISPSGCKCICSPTVQASEEHSSLGAAPDSSWSCAFCWEPCRAGNSARARKRHHSSSSTPAVLEIGWLRANLVQCLQLRAWYQGAQYSTDGETGTHRLVQGHAAGWWQS